MTQRYPHHLSSTSNQVRRSDYPTGPRQDQPERAGWPGTTPDTQEDPPRQTQEVVIHTPTHQQAPCAMQKICDAQMHQEYPEALQTLHTTLAQHTTYLENRDSQSVCDQSRATTVALDRVPDCILDVTEGEERPISVTLVKHRSHWRPSGIQQCRRPHRRL